MPPKKNQKAGKEAADALKVFQEIEALSVTLCAFKDAVCHIWLFISSK